MKVTEGLQEVRRGTDTYYLLGNELYTEAELERMERERQKHDEQKGYEDRKNHCYDKWYRYCRSDDGAAYDRGVVRCVNEAQHYSKKWQKDDENFSLIEAYCA